MIDFIFSVHRKETHLYEYHITASSEEEAIMKLKSAEEHYCGIVSTGREKIVEVTKKNLVESILD